MALLADFIQHWRQNFFNYRRPLLLVSAGADSTALLHLLLCCFNGHGDKTSNKSSLIDHLHVLHVNHGLRQTQNLAEEKFIRESCLASQYLKKPALTIVRQKWKYRHKNIQAQARFFRYFHAARLVKKFNLDCVIVAHHSDDAVETFLLALANGASVRTLGSFGKTRKMDFSNGKMVVLRPLLDHSKEDLLDYLREHRLDHCEDDTNAKLGYRRNFLRLAILPNLSRKFPNFQNNVLLTKKYLIEQSALLDFFLKKMIDVYGFVAIISPQFFMLTIELQQHILGIVLQPWLIELRIDAGSWKNLANTLKVAERQEKKDARARVLLQLRRKGIFYTIIYGRGILLFETTTRIDSTLQTNFENSFFEIYCKGAGTFSLLLEDSPKKNTSTRFAIQFSWNFLKNKDEFKTNTFVQNSCNNMKIEIVKTDNLFASDQRMASNLNNVKCLSQKLSALKKREKTAFLKKLNEGFRLAKIPPHFRKQTLVILLQQNESLPKIVGIFQPQLFEISTISQSFSRLFYPFFLFQPFRENDQYQIALQTLQS